MMSAMVPIAVIFKKSPIRSSFPCFAKKCVSQLEGDADPGQVLVGVFAAGLVRIYHGESRRVAARGIGNMVIGNYHVKTVVLRPLERLEAADAAIDADGQRKPIGPASSSAGVLMP